MRWLVVGLAALALAGCSTLSSWMPSWPSYICVPVRVEGVDQTILYCKKTDIPLQPVPSATKGQPT